MNHPIRRSQLAATIGLLLAGTTAFADGTRFDNFTPLTNSAGPTLDEATPITLSSPYFTQKSIAERQAQLAAGIPDSGNWDMITTNETGKDKGRYLFTVFETGQGGVQRHDRKTGKVETLWHALTPGTHVSFDASAWTPWGTYVTAEESWGDASKTHGRLFELKNPIKAPGITGVLNANSNAGADFVHQNVIPRTSHEGVQFDRDGNMYFIDELNGGCLFKYMPKAKMKDVLSGKADYFAAGQTFVLRVGDGFTPNATGAYEWVPFTDKNGDGLPGSVVITDANGVTSVDGRNTTDVPAFKGTDYQRPEDLQIQVVKGREYLYVATTTTHEVYRLDLKNKTISVFANRNTTDLATGLPVGAPLANPDNLAIDAEGNIYIVEDQPGGVSDDIWFAKDLNKDGDLNDEGEGIARWASNGTVGSEFTGLYFDPFNKNRAWVHIQHPDSANDRTIELKVRETHESGH